jgi:cytoskeletal protein RodZ
MPETIGTQLKQAREAKNLTIKKVEQATRIRAYQIEAIEVDDFESLPSLVQARAFIRLYADFLGVSLEEIIASSQVTASEPIDQITSTDTVQEPASEQLSGKDSESPPPETRKGIQQLHKLLLSLVSNFPNRNNRSKKGETIDSGTIIEENAGNRGLSSSSLRDSSVASEVHIHWRDTKIAP